MAIANYKEEKMSKKENIEKNVLHTIYNANTFLKIKQWLDGGDQMIFSFVNMEDKNKSLDIYLSADDMAVFMMEIPSIIDNLKNNAAKKEPEKYTIVYQSPYGGNATGNDGKPMSRYFCIQAGKYQPVILTAYAYPANKTNSGAFCPIKGAQPFKQVRVSLDKTFAKTLKLIQLKWNYLQDDYFKEKFRLSNMKAPKWEPDSTGNPSNCSVSREAAEDTTTSKQSSVKLIKRAKVISSLVSLENSKDFSCKVELNGKYFCCIFKDNIISKMDNWDSLKKALSRTNTTFQGEFIMNAEKSDFIFFLRLVS